MRQERGICLSSLMPQLRALCALYPAPGSVGEGSDRNALTLVGGRQFSLVRRTFLLGRAQDAVSASLAAR